VTLDAQVVGSTSRPEEHARWMRDLEPAKPIERCAEALRVACILKAHLHAHPEELLIHGGAGLIVLRAAGAETLLPRSSPNLFAALRRAAECRGGFSDRLRHETASAARSRLGALSHRWRHSRRTR
jgi:hypothetical protein